MVHCMCLPWCTEYRRESQALSSTRPTEENQDQREKHNEPPPKRSKYFEFMNETPLAVETPSDVVSKVFQ